MRVLNKAFEDFDDFYETEILGPISDLQLGVGPVEELSETVDNLEENFLGHDHDDQYAVLAHTHSDYEPLFVLKDEDETVNDSAALQDDNALGKLAALNTVYVVEARIAFNSGTTPDIKIHWTGPAGSSFVWNTLISVPQTLASTLAIDGTGADAVAMVHGVFAMGATAGGLQLQWAQNTQNASDTKVLTGSYLLLRKVA